MFSQEAPLPDDSKSSELLYDKKVSVELRSVFSLISYAFIHFLYIALYLYTFINID
jgi:hypothetical protein